MKSKNKKVLDEFVKYAKAHPEMRFYQALCCWSTSEIYKGNVLLSDREMKILEVLGLVDTFYKEGK